jgi:hypothetical protein
LVVAEQVLEVIQEVKGEEQILHLQIKEVVEEDPMELEIEVLQIMERAVILQ